VSIILAGCIFWDLFWHSIGLPFLCFQMYEHCLTIIALIASVRMPRSAARLSLTGVLLYVVKKRKVTFGDLATSRTDTVVSAAARLLHRPILSLFNSFSFSSSLLTLPTPAVSWPL
jgi:hypothetical protein